jgi:hypothetical protein
MPSLCWRLEIGHPYFVIVGSLAAHTSTAPQWKLPVLVPQVALSVVQAEPMAGHGAPASSVSRVTAAASPVETGQDG